MSAIRFSTGSDRARRTCVLGCLLVWVIGLGAYSSWLQPQSVDEDDRGQALIPTTSRVAEAGEDLLPSVDLVSMGHAHLVGRTPRHPLLLSVRIRSKPKRRAQSG